ncbi:hypothetical protein LCGC14_0979200 [marine sediment metagenome]|uniref:Uncharacterized protein n=1 Tax=marine sediment metagenome TaxID=412755 RepID=A0A0F9NDQ8_9ZZZZ
MTVDSSSLINSFLNKQKNGDFSDIIDSYLKKIDEILARFGNDYFQIKFFEELKVN